MQTVTKGQGRARELDSLRGLAALSVLGYHVLANNSPVLTAGVGLGQVPGRLTNLLVYTPLHVAWLGAESVWLFFVLSGFVLGRSAMAPTFDWGAYYPSRMVRLYLPVVGAVVVAWVTYLVPHRLTPQMDQLLPTAYPWPNVYHDITVVGGTTTSLGVLWSLQWEILFSLLLPVYILLVRRRVVLSSVIALVVLMYGWHYADGASSYLPMFFIGVLLAYRWESISAAFAWLRGGGVARNVAGAALFVLAICGITSFFLIGRSLHVTDHGPRELTLPLVLAGVALLVVLVQTWPPLTSILRMRPLAFFGDISFSLYLVHLPIVVLAIFVLHPGRTSAVVGACAALVAAVVFYRFVERPAHKLSRSLRSRLHAQAVAAAAGSTTLADARPAAPEPRDGLAVRQPVPEVGE